LGSPDAYLVGALRVHGASTAKVDIQATWTDSVDDPVNDPDVNTREQVFSSHVDEVPVMFHNSTEPIGLPRKVSCLTLWVTHSASGAAIVLASSTFRRNFDAEGWPSG